LVAGSNPQKFIPGAYIQFCRIDGNELGEPVTDAIEATGNLQNVVDTVLGKFTAYNKNAYILVENGGHITQADYPLEALKQILYNAVLHRDYIDTNAPVHAYWYDDYVEITSPGGPFGRVTPENFGTPGIAEYKNPALAAAMKNLSMIQHFGQGISVARKVMAENGNPPIEFNVDHNWVRVILRKHQPPA
jgi:ATP-dependent DNA helicase RecG